MRNKNGSSPGCFFIRHQGLYVKVNVGDIHWVESSKNYSCFHTGTGKFMALVALKTVLSFLPPDYFCQIQRGIIVSLEWITSVDGRKVHGEGGALSIGEAYRSDFMRQLTLIGEVAGGSAVKTTTYC